MNIPQRPESKSSHQTGSEPTAEIPPHPRHPRNLWHRLRRKANHIYRWLFDTHWRLALIAILALGLIIPVGWHIAGDISRERRYDLSAATRSLISTASPALAKQLTHRQGNGASIFDEAAFKASSASTDSVQLGSTSQDPLFGVKLPTDPAQGLTMIDRTTQLSFTIKPLFPMDSGKPVDNNGQPESPTVAASAIDHVVYPLADQSALAIYTAMQNGMKEDLTFTKAPAGGTVALRYQLDLPDTLQARLDSNGNLDIYSASPALYGNITYGSNSDEASVMKARVNSTKDNLLFVLPAPVIYQAGSSVTDPASSKATFSLEGNVLTVTASGLSELHYPIAIDPSVVVTAASALQANGNNEGDISFANNDVSTGDLTGGITASWETTGTTNLNQADLAPTVAYNGYLYIIGGASTYDQTPYSVVQYAPINSNGTIGSWSTTSSLTQATAEMSAVAYNGYIYVTGGCDGAGPNCGSPLTTVEYAPINSDGALGSWASTTALPEALYNEPTVAYDNYLYVLGGTSEGASDVDLNTVLYAPVNADGTLGAWTTNSNSFTNARDAFGAVAYNGYMYIMGGQPDGESSGSDYDDVQYAPINSNGSVGTWTTTSSFTTARDSFGYAVYDGYLYIMGGYSNASGDTNDDVQYAQINANGTIGTWQEGPTLNTGERGQGTAVYNGYIYEIDGGGNNDAVDQYAAIEPAGYLGEAASTTSLPTATYYASAIAYNGYVYEIGGYTGTATATVDYAPINSNGTLGSWTATTSLPAATYIATSVAYNGYVYEIGGLDTATGDVDTVDYAPINSNGTLGSWTATTSLPAATYEASSVAYNGYVYEVGGYSQYTGGDVATVDYAPINSNGTLGSWTATTSLPIATYVATSVAYNGYVYEIGGYTTAHTATVDYAPINSNGTLGSWTATTSLPAATYEASSVAYNGYIYEIGGDTGSGITATVDYAPINSNGTLGSWTATTSLPKATYRATSAVYNGYVYEIGGYTTAPTATVDYAPINNGGPGTVQSWGSATSLSTTTEEASSVAYNGYIYEIGGYTTAGVATVDYAPINSNGTLGSWTATTSLPAATYEASSVAYNGYIYEIGGSTGGDVATVDYAPINSNGTLGSWTATTSLPTATYYASAIAYNGYVYEIGGYTGTATATVDYAPINSNGTLGSWTATTSLPAATYEASSVAYNGYVYEIGGLDTATGDVATVDYAPINSNGTLGSWTATTSLPTATNYATSVAYNGYVYEIGGYGGSPIAATATVDYAPINSNGTLGSWTATTSLPTATYYASAIAYNGYVYEIGGYTTAGVATVDYAGLNSIPRVGQYSDLINTENYFSDAEPSLGSWTATTSLPAATDEAASVTYDGYVYEIGGGITATVDYAPINSNGTLGSWTATTSLPIATYVATSVAYNGYVYEIGGYTGTATATVDYAPINSNGTLGSWTATTSLPAATYEASSVAYNGYVYEIGGLDTATGDVATVDYAPINSNGTLGSWTATTSLPTATNYATSVAYNGYVYEIGGVGTATVDYAPINSNGTLGSWTATTSLPTATNYATSVAYNGYVYEIGGDTATGDVATVDYAPINSNGTLGSWTATTSLPKATYRATSAVYNGYVYEIGGYTTAHTATVDYAPFTVIASGDPTPSVLVLDGSNSGNQGSGGGVGGIRVSYELAGGACPTFGSAVPLAIDNGAVFGTSLSLPEATTGCGINSNGNYVWLLFDLDDSQTATFPDVDSNHTMLSQLILYYHPASGSRLRGGATFSGGSLQSLDTSP